MLINYILWVLFGALLGWLTGVVMHDSEGSATLRNILVGIVGAFLAGLLGPLFGVTNLLPLLFVACVGAFVLAFLVLRFVRPKSTT